MPRSPTGFLKVSSLQFLLKNWISIALLLKKPYELPGDQRSMKVAVVAAAITNVVATLILVESRFLVVEALLDIALAGICLYAGLALVGKRERFIQAFSAYCGVGVVLNVVSVVILGPTRFGQPTDPVGMVSLFLETLMLVWGIAAIAHIVRYSFEISLPLGIVAAVLYVQVYIMLASIFLTI